jgi:G:T-mismatch repair DNA endonuclease (very short patch repair protein)
LSRTGTNSLKGKSYEEIHGDEAEKIKENLSIKIKQAYIDNPELRILCAANKGKNIHTAEEKQKRSTKMLGNYFGRKRVKGMPKHEHSLESNRKRADSCRNTWASMSSKEKSSKVSKSRKNAKRTPNISEGKLEQLLNSLNLSYKYVGGGDLVIAGKIPDFVNINGQKKLIELYGSYWHRNDDPNNRIELFKEYGWKTLIIWEDELKMEEILKEKLLKFDKGGD